jgi:AbrB family looped-hinge helix DNA binding protein
MAEITITARVRRDGTLAIPKKARETLGLHEGDQIEITVNKPDTQAASSGGDPLLELIGIGTGGPADGAEDHDCRLYRHSSV